MAAVPSIGRASLVERPNVAPQAAATEGLYERHAARIQSYCQHQLGSREEAEDAVQTTFMNAFRALGRGVVPEAESAWLFKIAENVCLSRRRSSWRRGRIESPSDFDLIEEIIPGPNRQRDELIGIEDALAAMPEQQRRAILLREWQGLSYREVAEELEISQSAVETLIFRARRSLAQGLEQPDTIKNPKRKSFRRALHMIDLGTIAAAAKTLLAGSAAVKATAAAVAVTAVAGTAASVAPKLEPRSERLAAAPKHVVAKPAAAEAVVAPPSRSAAAAAARHFEGTPAARAAAARAKPAESAQTHGRRSAPSVVGAAALPQTEPVSVAAEPAAAEPAPAAPVAAEPAAASPVPEQPQHGQPKHEQAPVQPTVEQPRAEETRGDEGGGASRQDEGRNASETPAERDTRSQTTPTLEELLALIAKPQTSLWPTPVSAPVVQAPASVPAPSPAPAPAQTPVATVPVVPTVESVQTIISNLLGGASWNK